MGSGLELLSIFRNPGLKLLKSFQALNGRKAHFSYFSYFTQLNAVKGAVGALIILSYPYIKGKIYDKFSALLDILYTFNTTLFFIRILFFPRPEKSFHKWLVLGYKPNYFQAEILA